MVQYTVFYLEDLNLVNIALKKILNIILILGLCSSFIFALDTEKSSMFHKPISFYTGDFVPSNFHILKLISITSEKEEVDSETNALYQLYVSTGNIQTDKLNALLKKHYAHLVINNVLIESIDNEKLFLPQDILLKKDTVMKTRYAYAEFTEMIRKYYLSDEYFEYSKAYDDPPSFRDFIPVYTKSVQTAFAIRTIEQRIFDVLNELLLNVDNESYVQSSISDIIADIATIKAKMPYKNLPNNLLDVVSSAHNQYVDIRSDNKMETIKIRRELDAD